MASIRKHVWTTLDPKTGRRVSRKTKKWYIFWTDEAGRARKTPGYLDKAATLQKAAALERNAELRAAGVAVPDLDQQQLSAADQAEAFARVLEARGRTLAHVGLVRRRLAAVISGCGWARLAQVGSEPAQAWIAGRMKLSRAEGGFGAQTANHYVATLRGWANWLLDRGSLRADPFRALARYNARADRRHVRRALPPLTFGRLLVAARRSTRRPYQLSGEDRFALYLTAAVTGFRASELAAVEKEWVHLDAEPPHVEVPARHTKNGRPARVPIPRFAAARLAPWLATKPAGARLWPGRWAADCDAAKILRGDLAEAKIPYELAGKVFDFHALRRQYGTSLARAGVNTQHAQRLMRHSDPRLTMEYYTDLDLADLAGEAEKLGRPRPPAPG